MKEELKMSKSDIRLFLECAFDYHSKFEELIINDELTLVYEENENIPSLKAVFKLGDRKSTRCTLKETPLYYIGEMPELLEELEMFYQILA